MKTRVPAVSQVFTVFGSFLAGPQCRETDQMESEKRPPTSGMHEHICVWFINAVSESH